MEPAAEPFEIVCENEKTLHDGDNEEKRDMPDNIIARDAVSDKERNARQQPKLSL